jgi:hypothetical protein
MAVALVGAVAVGRATPAQAIDIQTTMPVTIDTQVPTATPVSVQVNVSVSVNSSTSTHTATSSRKGRSGRQRN